MNRKYVYEFVNEAVEIEISEEWETILREEDRMEYNTDHRETRRHEGLDIGMEGGNWKLPSIQILYHYHNKKSIKILKK